MLNMQQSAKKKSEILTSHYSSLSSGKVHSNKSNSEKSVKIQTSGWVAGLWGGQTVSQWSNKFFCLSAAVPIARKYFTLGYTGTKTWHWETISPPVGVLSWLNAVLYFCLYTVCLCQSLTLTACFYLFPCLIPSLYISLIKKRNW